MFTAHEGSSSYLSLAQAADILGVGPKTIRRMIARGDLAAYRIAGSRLIRVERAEVVKCLTAITSARSGRGIA